MRLLFNSADRAEIAAPGAILVLPNKVSELPALSWAPPPTLTEPTMFGVGNKLNKSADADPTLMNALAGKPA